MRPRSLPVMLLGTLATALCAGATSAAAAPLRAQTGAYEVQVLVDGVAVPAFQHGGETWVLGALGDRYTIRVINRTGRRIEAVASVDGRDVVDGRPADFRTKRGYIVPAWGSVEIEGWRLSESTAAAFRFSRVADSYAARTGRARDVGVIGVAVFAERYVPPPRPIVVAPPPPPPHWWWRDRAAPSGESAPSKSAPGATSSPAPGPLADAEESARSYDRPSHRPGLGTEFGEAVSAPVVEAPFVRQSPARPDAVLGVRYNDHDGLVALGIDVDHCGCDCMPGCVDEASLRRSAEPFPTWDRSYAAPPPGWSR